MPSDRDNSDVQSQKSDPTPGRPKSSSRQQTQPDQTQQTGSSRADAQLSDGSEPSTQLKPAGAK